MSSAHATYDCASLVGSESFEWGARLTPFRIVHTIRMTLEQTKRGERVGVGLVGGCEGRKGDGQAAPEHGRRIVQASLPGQGCAKGEAGDTLIPGTLVVHPHWPSRLVAALLTCVVQCSFSWSQRRQTQRAWNGDHRTCKLCKTWACPPSGCPPRPEDNKNSSSR
jgi:hypothetical protein